MFPMIGFSSKKKKERKKRGHGASQNGSVTWIRVFLLGLLLREQTKKGVTVMRNAGPCDGP